VFSPLLPDPINAGALIQTALTGLEPIQAINRPNNRQKIGSHFNKCNINNSTY
jgi:hypothetical protein